MAADDSTPKRAASGGHRRPPSRDSVLPTLAWRDRENDETRPEKPVESESAPVPQGKTIGPYVLLLQIGQGGMGTVFLAEQTEPIKRRVAIKVVRAGMSSQEVIARFDAERRTLALMSHPNIAQILDAGETEEHQPYFVMEYVPGTALNEYCDSLKLPPGKRLELLEEVCSAVQHAHQRGIIHRDLKPSNILVTRDGDRPIPKIIDFGIAKATERIPGTSTMETQIGAIVGTPEYASPEQLGTTAADIDTRADVYSLGVILYELVTGRPPFVFRGRHLRWVQIQKIVREEEPTPPSRALAQSPELPSIAEMRGTQPATLIREAKGELEWIAMRALEKEPHRRYQSPAALAADLRRLRENQPLEASPHSAAYRLRKLIQRHLLVSAVCAAAALVLAVSGTLFALRLRTERDTAKQQAALARHERDRAVAARDFLLGVIQSTNPYQAPNPARRVDALFEAAARSLAGRFPADPEMEATLLQQFGRSLMALERNQTAGEALERAEELLAGHVPATHPVLIETRGRLIDLYRLRRENGRASKLAAMQMALCGPDSKLPPVTCLAIRNDHIEVTMATQDPENALAEIEETLGFARDKMVEGDYEAVFTDYLAGRVFRDLGRTTAAAQSIFRLVERTLRAVPARHPGLLTDMLWLSWIAYDLGDTELALRCSEYALSGRRALYPEATRYVYEALQQRAIIALGAGDPARARSDFQAILETVPADDPALASFSESATAWLALMDQSSARPASLHAAEASRARAVGPGGPGMAELRLLLAAGAIKRQDGDAAAQFLNTARGHGGLERRPYLLPLALVLESHAARLRKAFPEAARLETEAERVLAQQERQLFDPVAGHWVGPLPHSRGDLTAKILKTAQRIGEVRKSPF